MKAENYNILQDAHEMWRLCWFSLERETLKNFFITTFAAACDFAPYAKVSPLKHANFF
jgi:hypothetical protein